MMRQAATTALLFRNFSRRAAAPGSLDSARQHGRGGAQRLLASSSKTPPPPTPRRDKGQEAIEKAARLHAELSELISTQKARQAEERQRPFGSSFRAFLKASKPEIVNIFFAFVCVLLAYQIHGMRAGIKTLRAAQEEKDAELDRLRGILSGLSTGNAAAGDAEGDGTFATRAAEKCAGAVREMFAESEKRAGYGWILGKGLASAESMEARALVDNLRPVIQTEIRAAVGEAAFSPEEAQERRVAALKAEVETSLPLDGSVGSEGGDKGAHMGDLMQILEEVHDQDLADGTQPKAEDGEHATTTVRRTRYAI